VAPGLSKPALTGESRKEESMKKNEAREKGEKPKKKGVGKKATAKN